MIGNRLGVIAGRRGDDAGCPLRVRQLQQFVERAALLVGSRELQIFELQPDFRIDDLRKGLALQHRGADHRTLDPFGCGANVVESRAGFGGSVHKAVRLDLPRHANNAIETPMRMTLVALTALLASSSALADTLVTNANGIQVDTNGKLDRFTGILIGGDGKVKRLLHGEMLKLRDTNVVDAKGQTVVPGLIDAHGHVMALGFTALQLDLTGTTSLADLQARLKAYAEANPNAKWIIGRGWNQELWAEKRFPTSADLDAVVADRPVWLARVDGHAGVANGTA